MSEKRDKHEPALTFTDGRPAGWLREAVEAGKPTTDGPWQDYIDEAWEVVQATLDGACPAVSPNREDA